MRKGNKQQERTHRGVTCIKNGKMTALCDTKLQTGVVGIEGQYDFRTNTVVERGELDTLNKQFDKAVSEANREYLAKHGSMFRDKILVCNTNTNSKALKAGAKYRATFQYLLSLRDKRHIFNDLGELETVQFMKDMITIFDEAMMHALDDYNYADMINKADE